MKHALQAHSPTAEALLLAKTVILVPSRGFLPPWVVKIVNLAITHKNKARPDAICARLENTVMTRVCRIAKTVNLGHFRPLLPLLTVMFAQVVTTPALMVSLNVTPVRLALGMSAQTIPDVTFAFLVRPSLASIHLNVYCAMLAEQQPLPVLPTKCVQHAIEEGSPTPMVLLNASAVVFRATLWVSPPPNANSACHGVLRLVLTTWVNVR